MKLLNRPSVHLPPFLVPGATSAFLLRVFDSLDPFRELERFDT